MTTTVRVAMMAGVIWVGVCAGARGQVTRQPAYPPGVQAPGMNDPMNDPRVPKTDGRLSEKMAISRNDERQRKLVADTNQLFDLASKLKDEVDKTDKYTLSLDVLKRTAEIEKLAKSIRERMKD